MSDIFYTMYKNIFRTQGSKIRARRILEFAVNQYAKFNRFYFPQKFTWRWKLEMLTEKYEKETTMLFKKIIKPGMTVVDIGAHIGYFTRIFSKLVGPSGLVYAFEPDPDNFQLLKKNVSMMKNVFMHDKAISDHNGRVDFFQNTGKTGSHSLIAHPDRLQKIMVEAVTLDTAMDMEKVKNIDLIKMDIEGAELKAFLGMKNIVKTNNALNIVMEFSLPNIRTAGYTYEEIIKKFNSEGFIFFVISKDGLIPLSLYRIEEIQGLKNQFVNVFITKNPVQNPSQK